MNTGKTLYKSQTNKMLAGVCGGLGEYLDIDPTLIRVLFVVLAPSLIIYIILALIIPYGPDANDNF